MPSIIKTHWSYLQNTSHILTRLPHCSQAGSLFFSPLNGHNSSLSGVSTFLSPVIVYSQHSSQTNPSSMLSDYIKALWCFPPSFRVKAKMVTVASQALHELQPPLHSLFFSPIILSFCWSPQTYLLFLQYIKVFVWCSLSWNNFAQMSTWLPPTLTSGLRSNASLLVSSSLASLHYPSFTHPAPHTFSHSSTLPCGTFS
jgi:hypothetical protein